jgi:hypothetical protein
VRDQYVGDVSDMVKLSFLRALARDDRTLGVAWYYVSGHDGRSDGKHTEWCGEVAWRQLDPQLYIELLALNERKVVVLQNAPIWPKKTLFHIEQVPEWRLRDVWSQNKRNTLDEANLVFLDPDNGVGKRSLKHATFAELKHLRKPGRAIVFITFPGRNFPHDELVQKLHERLCREAGVRDMITLRTNVSVPSLNRPGCVVPRQRWLTIADPDQGLIDRARKYEELLSSIPRVSTRLDVTAYSEAKADSLRE